MAGRRECTGCVPRAVSSCGGAAEELHSCVSGFHYLKEDASEIGVEVVTLAMVAVVAVTTAMFSSCQNCTATTELPGSSSSSLSSRNNRSSDPVHCFASCSPLSVYSHKLDSDP